MKLSGGDLLNKENNNRSAELRNRLREALDDRGMKPIELAEQADVPKSMISYYLSGKSVPKADRVYKMAQVLGVNEAWLLGYDVPKIRTPGQKKNDTLVDVVSKLRNDPDFFDLCTQLSELPAEEYASIKTLISALRKK
jgi:transcriptional regulator with XRE-family HTH domain